MLQAPMAFRPGKLSSSANAGQVNRDTRVRAVVFLFFFSTTVLKHWGQYLFDGAFGGAEHVDGVAWN